MKIVRENINFERGLDPKKAIGIGKYWAKTKGEIAKEIFNACEIRAKKFINDVHKEAKKAGYADSFDYAQKIYQEEEDESLKKIYKVEDKIEILTAEIKKILQEYPIMKDRSLEIDLSNFFVVGEPPPGTMLTIIEDALDPRLNESVYFERGMDPKKSMGIGQEAAKQKLIGMIPDLSRSSLWKGDYENIISNIKRYDTFIEFIDKYIIIKSPVLKEDYIYRLRIFLNWEHNNVELVDTSDRYISYSDPNLDLENKNIKSYKFKILEK